MSRLIIRNKVISDDLMSILKRLKLECAGLYFNNIQSKAPQIQVTCPFHSSGQERHPSCGICARVDDPKAVFGTYHCFACGAKGSLSKLVSHCLSTSLEKAETWLIDNFAEQKDWSDDIDLSEFEFEKKPVKTKYMDESILNRYNFYHDYMWKRHLNKEVVDRFSVGFDPETNSVTFPVWDEHNHLVEISRRCVDNKTFMLQKSTDKPVYLLNFLLNKGFKTVIITESQINALTCHKYHLPAVALCGTGSEHQYQILNKASIPYYILCFDGDDAGRHGAEKFKKYIHGAVIDEVIIPEGRDINDISEETFMTALKSANVNVDKIIADYENKFVKTT